MNKSTKVLGTSQFHFANEVVKTIEVDTLESVELFIEAAIDDINYKVDNLKLDIKALTIANDKEVKELNRKIKIAKAKLKIVKVTIPTNILGDEDKVNKYLKDWHFNISIAEKNVSSVEGVLKETINNFEENIKLKEHQIEKYTSRKNYLNRKVKK